MSENTISLSVPSKTRRMLTNRDKVIAGITIVLVTVATIFTYWFTTSTGPGMLKWALVGSSFAYAMSLVGVLSAGVLCALHFCLVPGSMKTVKWVLLLLLYIALGIGSVASVNYFADLTSSYQTKIDVLSVCQEDGMSADECAGIAANLGVEKDR